ncbi:MAG TPA: 4Fe-4S dicluster domain-containing protein, partial [Symbiobacteriaceae bacterium]|nr:4Fe-4S dicluster domain-containing protein [Symbiobacteriaceae bacterium]
NRSTMHLELRNLPQNRDICASCGLCMDVCHMDVDPRTTDQKHCVACGDCLDACILVSGARKVPRVLNFVVGAGSLLPRVTLPVVLVLLLSGVTAYGLATRELVSVVVAKDHRAVMTTGGTTSGGGVMRVSIMNLSGSTDTFTLSVVGLPEGWVHLEQSEVTLVPGGKTDVILRVVPTEFRRGLHNFQVDVKGITTRAADTFKSVYVVGN